MANPDPTPNELSTLIDDVKTIKSILQTTDAPFPHIWKALVVGGSTILTLALVQYFVPFFKAFTFDEKVLYLWLPTLCVLVPVVMTIVHRELRRVGKRILSQFRFRHLFFAGIVVPPSIFMIGYIVSRSAPQSFEGVLVLLIAIWQATITAISPSGFRVVPVVFMSIGFVELSIGLTGPEVLLFNLVTLALAIGYGAYLFYLEAKKNEVVRV